MKPVYRAQCSAVKAVVSIAVLVGVRVGQLHVS